jgi:hypothetical protein
MKKQLFIILMLVCGMSMYAQSIPVTTDSIMNAEYREKIGLDMTVPDFDTKKIDGKVMGTRLAGILDFLLENYHQGTYEKQITQMVKEQNEALENLFFNIKKMKFISAKKRGDEITIVMRVWSEKNEANVKQADFAIHFIDGITESWSSNDMFSSMSRYVQGREQLK